MKANIGEIFLVASEKGLQGVLWKRQAAPMAASLDGDEPAIRILKRSVRELEEYFEGARKNFELPLDVIGTEFQRKVWEQLTFIPYGKTASYADIANRLGNPNAVRAVGAANGKNPLSIVVPCHRVIASNGALTGYAGGLEIKTALLLLERNGRERNVGDAGIEPATSTV